MPADSDEERMSERSWDCVGTPPPSPPSSPLPGASDEEVDEDEDGFLNITAEDYREYDRWFGEEEEQINEIRMSHSPFFFLFYFYFALFRCPCTNASLLL
jgi:hypothetical protein